MDTRLLYVIAFGIAILSGLFYFYSGKSAQLAVQKNQDMSYSATKVQLLKTDQLGQLEATTQADKIQHWELENRSELDNLHSTWYEQGQPAATFSAQHATSLNNNEKVLLTGNVFAQRLDENGQPQVSFRTTQLTGYPKLQQIETKHPVFIQGIQGQLSSQGLHADLKNGQFNLFHIRGQYAPASGS